MQTFEAIFICDLTLYTLCCSDFVLRNLPSYAFGPNINLSHFENCNFNQIIHRSLVLSILVMVYGGGAVVEVLTIGAE